MNRSIQSGALCLLAFLLPFTLFIPIAPPVIGNVLSLYASPGLTITDAVALGVVLLLSMRSRWEWPPLMWGFVVLTGLALLTADSAVSPRLALVSASRWGIAALLFLLLAQPGVPWRRMVRYFLLGLAVQVAVGVAQVVLQGPIGLFGELALPPEQPGAAVLSVGGRRWLRAYGLTFHPNVLGGYLTIGLLVALPLLRERAMRLLWFWLALGLLLTFSRSAWLALAVTLPLLALWLMRQHAALRRPLALSLGSGLLLMTVAVIPLAPQVWSRLAPTSDSGTESYSLDERAVLASIAADFIRARPLTGWGAGNFPVAMVVEGYRERAHPVHNVPLLLAAEVGILGVLGWLWLWLFPMARTRACRSPWPPALLAAWLALSVIALWDHYPWSLSTGRLLAATVLAWWVQAQREAAAPPPLTEPASSSVGR